MANNVSGYNAFVTLSEDIMIGEQVGITAANGVFDGSTDIIIASPNSVYAYTAEADGGWGFEPISVFLSSYNQHTISNGDGSFSQFKRTFHANYSSILSEHLKYEKGVI